MPWVETPGANAPDRRFTLSLSRRAPHRKTLHGKTLHGKALHRKAVHGKAQRRRIPKISLIAAGSALALAGIAAGTVAAWPGTSPAASASVAGASFAGSAAQAGTLTGAAARDNGLARSVQELKASEAAARQAAVRQAIARQRARKAARAAAPKAAAAKAAVARAAAARQHQAAAAAAQPATPTGSPQQIAQGMLGSYGWSASQFSCLQPLWNAESGWNVSASNTSSGAYGIPQALPGSKMASAGADWQTNAATQIGPHRAATTARIPGASRPPRVTTRAPCVTYFIPSLFPVLVMFAASLRHGRGRKHPACEMAAPEAARRPDPASRPYAAALPAKSAGSWHVPG